MTSDACLWGFLEISCVLSGSRTLNGDDDNYHEWCIRGSIA